MKETGIIMSGRHPRLVLDGLKTMTRRVIKDPDKLLFFQVAGASFYCPYGHVGDRLWVRETFRINSIGGVSYKAEEGASWIGKWKPSIHMFKKHARIWLEITGLRAERVQDISEADCVAEGIVMNNLPWDGWYWLKDVYSTDSPQIAFSLLWDSLNAKRGYGWDTNCWVWVISFKLLTER